MNDNGNFNNTSGSAGRNTYYNMELPEWRCENCGRFNNREARFCRSCGTPGPIANTDIYVAEMPQKKGGAGKWIAIVAAIVIVVAVLTVAVIKLILPKDDQTETTASNTQTETVNNADSSTANSSSTNSSTANNDSANGSTASSIPADSSNTVSTSNQSADSSQDSTSNSYYVVGGTYYVQPKEGLKVRCGPGKNYDQLYRDSLNSDEYAKSLSGTYACLKQGSSVVCQGMSDDGNWMQISSGWICVYDGSETLVR